MPRSKPPTRVTSGSRNASPVVSCASVRTTSTPCTTWHFGSPSAAIHSLHTSTVLAAVAIGLQAIPPAFNWKRSRLRWGYLENRPFMRAYQALALHRMDQRAWDDAILILGRLLAVNPNDNQGVRYELPQCWFETGDVDAVVEHCRAHRTDTSPFIRYTNALALTMASRVPEAREALESAIRGSPLVARELLAERHPEPDDGFPGSYVLGGPSEAWVYWDAYGTYWRRSKEAMKLLRELADVA